MLFHKWNAYIFENYIDRRRKSYTSKAFCSGASQNLSFGKDLFINVVLMTPETTLITIIPPTYIDTSYNCSCRWYKALFTTVTIAFETDKWMPVGYFISWPPFREVSLSKTGSSAVSCVGGATRKNNLADHIFSWWKFWGPRPSFINQRRHRLQRELHFKTVTSQFDPQLHLL